MAFWSIKSNNEYSVAKKDEDGFVVIKQHSDGETAAVYLTQEDFEAMIAAYQNNQETESTEPAAQSEPQHQDISANSIEEIEAQISAWVGNLKEGDEVFAMHSPVAGWQVSDRSYASNVAKVTDKRVTLDDGTIYHRKSGVKVKGVNENGDYRLIPPCMRDKDLDAAWLAQQAIQQSELLHRVPIGKLMAALELLESQD